jgi:chromosome segregation ATPase
MEPRTARAKYRLMYAYWRMSKKDKSIKILVAAVSLPGDFGRESFALVHLTGRKPFKSPFPTALETKDVIDQWEADRKLIRRERKALRHEARVKALWIVLNAYKDRVIEDESIMAAMRKFSKGIQAENKMLHEEIVDLINRSDDHIHTIEKLEKALRTYQLQVDDVTERYEKAAKTVDSLTDYKVRYEEALKERDERWGKAIEWGNTAIDALTQKDNALAERDEARKKAMEYGSDFVDALLAKDKIEADYLQLRSDHDELIDDLYAIYDGPGNLVDRWEKFSALMREGLV